MIGDDDARSLRRLLEERGQPWQPRPGDRFRVPDRDLDDAEFVVAEMTIEVVQAIGGPLIRFNGTTEWALDSIAAADVIWLPWEHQLRELLGEELLSLERLPGPAGGHAVTLADGRRFVHVSPDTAYLAAVLAVLGTAG